MSKKIIYLLSLLMALSLVFASCKKNPAGVNGDINEPIDNSPSTDSGLADSEDWLNQNSSEPIKNNVIELLANVGGQAYYRNPVIVVLGEKGNHVAVFAEKRHKGLGADNDIAVDGKTGTDIVYITSLNSGKNWQTRYPVGRDSESQTPAEAVASPVVFKLNNNKVAVVGSAGVGISRVKENYSSRGEGQVSKLWYAVGTYDESSGRFTWIKKWCDFTDTVKNEIDNNSSIFDTQDGKQFGVHSARGFVDNSGNMYLAVTVSDEGNSTTLANSKEIMGNILFKGAEKDGTITWTVINNSAVKFNDPGADNFTSHKESIVIGVDADNTTSANQINYITVGNPWKSPENTHNKIGSAKGGSQPANNDIAGSEGSPAYLKVLNWQGQTPYDPNTYKNTGGTSRGLFAHVKSKISTITMYAYNDDFVKTGSKEYKVIDAPGENNYIAKSSSMDILGDGTIIMAAEQGGKEREYKIVYKRFTQKFLAEQLGIN